MSPKNDAWKTFFLLKQSLFRVNIRYIRSFSGVIRGFSIPKPVEDSVLAGQDCLCTVDGRNPAPVDMVNIPFFTWSMVLYIPGGVGFQPSTVGIIFEDFTLIRISKT